MNELSILVIGLSFSSVVLFVIALKNLFKRKTNIAKFTTQWEDDTYKVYEKKKRKKVNPVLLMFIIVGSVSGFIVIFLVTGTVKFSLIGLFVGFLIPSIWAKNHKKKQLNLMYLQLEQTAEVLSSVLRSGSGIVDALERASIEINDPLKNELTITANEIKLGLSNAVAFQNLAMRVDIDELNLLSMAINLQDEGMAINLSTLLEQIRDNIRYKLSYQRQVKVITAENKIAGWLVSALPFATLGMMRLIMPDMVSPLFTTTLGLSIFSVCVVVIVVGILWLMKISDFEV